jgi:hypothetical protein
MSHIYEVHTSDGTYNVTTDNHHDNHDDAWFREHLAQAILNIAVNVVGGVILHHYRYKGRR